MSGASSNGQDWERALALIESLRHRSVSPNAIMCLQPFDKELHVDRKRGEWPQCLIGLEGSAEIAEIARTASTAANDIWAITWQDEGMTSMDLASRRLANWWASRTELADTSQQGFTHEIMSQLLEHLPLEHRPLPWDARPIWIVGAREDVEVKAGLRGAMDVLAGSEGQSTIVFIGPEVRPKNEELEQLTIPEETAIGQPRRPSIHRVRGRLQEWLDRKVVGDTGAQRAAGDYGDVPVPKLVCLFNSGVGTITGPIAGPWMDALPDLLATGAPLCMATYNKRESMGEIALLGQCFQAQILTSQLEVRNIENAPGQGKPGSLAQTANAVCWWARRSPETEMPAWRLRSDGVPAARDLIHTFDRAATLSGVSGRLRQVLEWEQADYVRAQLLETVADMAELHPDVLELVILEGGEWVCREVVTWALEVPGFDILPPEWRRGAEQLVSHASRILAAIHESRAGMRQS